MSEVESLLQIIETLNVYFCLTTLEETMMTIIVLLEFTAVAMLCMLQMIHSGSVVPQSCPTQEQLAFTSKLPNATVCGPSIKNVLCRVTDFNTTVRDLHNVCNENCGGNFSDFLRSESSKDTLGALTLKLSCTMTDGTAEVGPYCRFALRDTYYTIFSVLSTCDTNTTCEPGCREALVQLKSQIGCCYQNLYNNTEYLSGHGYVSRNTFDQAMKLNSPQGNAWDLCGVTSPKKCAGEPFGKPLLIIVWKELSW